MDQFLNDPAGRLYLFLKDSKERSHGRATVEAVWNEYLGATNRFDLVQKLAPVVSLPEQITEEVAQLVDAAIPAEELLEYLPQAVLALAYAGALDSTSDRMAAHIDSGMLTSLRHCSRTLSHHQWERVDLAEDQLEEVRTAAQLLLDQVLDSEDLDPELRKILLDHAHSILRAVNMYKTLGIKGILDESDRLAGHISRSRGQFMSLVRHAPLLDKLKNLVLALSMAANAIHAPGAIAQDVGGYLELLPELPVAVSAPGPVMPDGNAGSPVA